jgi:hypothetical protein
MIINDNKSLTNKLIYNVRYLINLNFYPQIHKNVPTKRMRNIINKLRSSDKIIYNQFRTFYNEVIRSF